MFRSLHAENPPDQQKPTAIDFMMPNIFFAALQLKTYCLLILPAASRSFSAPCLRRPSSLLSHDMFILPNAVLGRFGGALASWSLSNLRLSACFTAAAASSMSALSEMTVVCDLLFSAIRSLTSSKALLTSAAMISRVATLAFFVSYTSILKLRSRSRSADAMASRMNPAEVAAGLAFGCSVPDLPVEVPALKFGIALLRGVEWIRTADNPSRKV